MFGKIYWGGGALLGVFLLILGITADSVPAIQQANFIESVAVENLLDDGAETTIVEETKNSESTFELKTLFEAESEPAPRCHSSYSGCLNPNASDYDCASGSGNGPYYTGQVQVFGYDEFDLDRDNDGWGCE